jgi:DNA-binding CsgD family transcriptional regulator
MAGSVEPATTAINELDALRTDWMMLFEPDLVDRGRAWTLVAGGEVTSARQLLKAAASRAGSAESWVAEARLLHDVARLGEPRVAVTRLTELAQLIDGGLVPIMAAHAAALLRDSGDDLDGVSERFDEIGASLLAAEAATAAAAAFRTEGSTRRATACARRAAELEEMCGHPRTPGLVSDTEVNRLSKREREVVGLALQGRTSKEIAEGLYVSQRTVQNHLQNAYRKLGVTNREELAHVLTRR